MNSMYKLTAVLLVAAFAIACGNASKPAEGDRQAELQKLKEEQTKLNEKIRTMEDALAKTDTSAAAKANAKLVEITPVAANTFTHFIDLQGKVDAENIAYVSPRGQGGLVRAVLVKQGQHVNKGQLLMRLDDAVTSQQIDQLKVQLNLAKTMYERRKNLWDKQIGTEIELIQAKSNVENLEKQLALLNEQHSMANVYAEISGVADMVTIKVGEFFTPASASVKGIRIVNTNNLKVVVEVPENYLDKVKQGSEVQISFPDINKTITSKVSVKGSTIDPSTRSFYIEAKIPNNKDVRPNQIALVKIQDYEANNAITIPMNTLQNDEKGKYVMVAVTENGRLLARKKTIEVGELYGNNLEVKSGLKPEDALITEGFQGLYDGQLLVTGDKS
ncbi:MAG: efflux RND transporter periplasmic adaptor subunit [Chitinophagaceae bacterium]|nr:efflux RND transporter periplasmic adaptor subunit [Chitinophagaceae bacterium]